MWWFFFNTEGGCGGFFLIQKVGVVVFNNTEGGCSGF